MDGHNCVRPEGMQRPAVHRPDGTVYHIRPKVRTSGGGLGGGNGVGRGLVVGQNWVGVGVDSFG